MKKDESKTYKNLKKDLSLKTIVIVLMCVLGAPDLIQTIAQTTSQTSEQLNEIVSQQEEFREEDELSSNAEEEEAEPAASLTEQSSPFISEEPTQISNTEEKLVEVIPYNQSVEVLKYKQYENYRDRRTTHGFMMSLATENIYFADYISQHDQLFYEDLWGQEDVSMPQINLNYKLNFKLGSITLGAGYGIGSIVDDRIGDERTITVEKTTGTIQFLLDNLMSEPYFVPYVGASIFEFKIGEHVLSTDTKYSSESEYGNAYTIGFLIQLNWIEKSAAKEAYLNHGLENTYLDIFWTQYDNPNEEPLPNVQSELNWGAGLRVEF